MPITNVTLNNTFDEWRTTTNQLITFVNDVDSQQLLSLGPSLANTARDHANSATLLANAGIIQANVARDHANAAHESANAGLLQANTARDHANAAFAAANNAVTDYSPAFNRANSVYNYANIVYIAANSGFIQANTARDHANAAFAAANSGASSAQAFAQANTARDQANSAFSAANSASTNSSNQAFVQANTARNQANSAFAAANAALSNTSGISFAGNIQFPTGNIVIGEAAAQGIRLHVNASIGIANIFPQIRAAGGTQFINLNANTNFGGWNDLTLDRDLTIIYSKGGADDGANLVIGPWTDSSFGYKQDGQGRHGFNTSNPRYELDANGTANISGSLLVGAMNVVPTVTSSFAQANAGLLQANTARDHANTAHASANIGLLQANTARVHANVSFEQANTARDHANTAHASANIGLLQANTARVHANVSFEQANTARVHANVSFEQANTARVHSNTAHASANAGLLQANTARDHANAAFAKANIGGISIVDVDSIDTSRYIIFGNGTTGTLANANVSTTLIYNPSTGTLSSTLFNSTSDINKKRDITIIDNPLEKVDQLNGVHFYWKDSGLPSAGLIAQDLIKVMPELVASDMSVTYSGVIGLLVEAIKELNDRIKKLENK